jgi:hypothetical protein
LRGCCQPGVLASGALNGVIPCAPAPPENPTCTTENPHPYHRKPAPAPPETRTSTTENLHLSHPEPGILRHPHGVLPLLAAKGTNQETAFTSPVNDREDFIFREDLMDL